MIKIRVATIKYIGDACRIFPAKIPEIQTNAGNTIGLEGDLFIISCLNWFESNWEKLKNPNF